MENKKTPPKKNQNRPESKTVSIDLLKPNPKNPRKISKDQRERLKKSLTAFGDLSGIVYNRRTQQLIGGHQRIDVFKGLGDDPQVQIEKVYTVPTRAGTVEEGFIIIDEERYSYREVDWDENQEKAANIAANKHGGDFDLSALSEWLIDLDGMNMDMDLTGFSHEEIINLVAPVTKVPPKEADDAVPSLPKVHKSVRGDIFQLGNHRLMCGDSTDITAIETLLNGSKPELLYTDPPYGIGAVENSNRIQSFGYEPIIGDDSTNAAADAYAAAAALKIPVMLFWGANHYASHLPDSPCWIIWDKQDGKRVDFADCEMAWTNHKKPARIFKHIWDGFRKDSEKGDKRMHPTQKPVALAEWCFNEMAPEAKEVLDLFGGSGSTLIACEKLGKRCLMMELSPSYVDVIISRYIKYTSKEVYRIEESGSLINWEDIFPR